MRNVLANLALLSGGIGFIAFLALILSGFLSCCSGLDSIFYERLVIIILLVSVIFFGLCMYNNCCIKNSKNSR